MAYPQSTQGGGVFLATNFAYGVSKRIPGLKLFSGNAATGAQSVTVVNQWFTAPDGSIVAPLATTTPITVGTGSTQDSVTPSAVTNSNTSYLAPGSGGLTATFTYTHGQGEVVATATVGLQEAINYCTSVYGGGVVVVDKEWASLGGTTAMINAAVNGATVMIVDNRGPVPANYVWNSTTSLFAASGPSYVPIAVAASGAIAPHVSGVYVITKAGVAAMTLAAPTATTDDGKVIVVTSNTANAHTITATGLLQTGSASVNVATFAASAGATVALMAYQAKWNVLYSTGITFS